MLRRMQRHRIALISAVAAAMLLAIPAAAQAATPSATLTTSSASMARVQKLTVAPSQAQEHKLRITATAKTATAEITAQSSCPVKAYGYTGYAMCGTEALSCDWYGNGLPEWFVIAPNREIWHTWDGAGGWYQMPNNGLADNTWNCYWNGNGQRQVEVQVSGDGIWYSYYSGGWNGWYRYPGT
jgi:hypothetical protein